VALVEACLLIIERLASWSSKRRPQWAAADELDLRSEIIAFAAGLNRAIKQRAKAACVSASERIPL
jgi:hypothetical protein